MVLAPVATCRSQKAKRPKPPGILGRLVGGELGFGYASTRYVRSPVSLFVDSTFSPIFLPPARSGTRGCCGFANRWPSQSRRASRPARGGGAPARFPSCCRGEGL